jgi:hypothetical protein
VSALGDEKVRGLDVAVNDSFGVRRVEGVRDFDAEVEEGFEFDRPGADAVLQRDAIEKLHCDKGFAVLIVDVVDGADVGMIEGGRGLGLTLKAGKGLGIAGDFFGKEFERDEAVETRVFGLINDFHAATAELFNDAVVRNGLTDHVIAVW